MADNKSNKYYCNSDYDSKYKRGKTAKQLGAYYDIGPEIMNQLLVNEQYLSGGPGDYLVTDKGMQFATEKDFHRGTGGYSQYNRYWTVRYWDESIKEDMDITPEKIQEAKRQVSERKKRQNNNSNLQDQSDYPNEIEPVFNINVDEQNPDYRKSLCVLGAGIIAIECVKKAAPYTRNLIDDGCRWLHHNVVVPWCKRIVERENNKDD